MSGKLKSPQRPWEPARITGKQAGRTETTNFYRSAAWRNVRAIYISQHPLCEQCEREGRTTAAKEIDHIKPIRQGGEALSFDNLQSLCSSCHAKKSAKEKIK